MITLDTKTIIRARVALAPTLQFCPNGHALDEGTAYLRPDKSLACLRCMKGQTYYPDGPRLAVIVDALTEMYTSFVKAYKQGVR